MRAAFDLGINFLAVTLDSEVEALGRNLVEIPVPYRIFVQTRPQGMVYGYGPGNRKMARYDLLEAEVHRLLELLRRERIDFFNVAFLQSALDEDPDYLTKIAANVERLKAAGLIRYASADTFSGEATYLRQIETGCFFSIFVNFNIGDDCAIHEVLPAAPEAGMAVIAREIFLKGALFRVGEQAGIMDRNMLARIALKWVLAHNEVTTAVVGADNPEQLKNSVAILDSPSLTEDEHQILERVFTTDAYNEYAAQRKEIFIGL